MNIRYKVTKLQDMGPDRRLNVFPGDVFKGRVDATVGRPMRVFADPHYDDLTTSTVMDIGPPDETGAFDVHTLNSHYRLEPLPPTTTDAPLGAA